MLIRCATTLLGVALQACNAADVDPAQELILAQPAASLPATLASATGLQGYRVDSTPRSSGRIVGVVRFDGALPDDVVMQPTHDQHVCRVPLTQSIVGDALGIGDAVVWLVGVTHGPADASPRRIAITLENCVLVPRVLRASVGATLMVRSADNMDVRLRFTDMVETVDDEQRVDAVGPEVDTSSRSAEIAPRALVPLGDAGAVVPLTSVLETPGLVAVTDDKHPWVHGWIAVAPHPFVAVSSRDGRFAFDGIPPGQYVLVAWHERLGRIAMRVLVDDGVETRLIVTLPG